MPRYFTKLRKYSILQGFFSFPETYNKKLLIRKENQHHNILNAPFNQSAENLEKKMKNFEKIVHGLYKYKTIIKLTLQRQLIGIFKQQKTFLFSSALYYLFLNSYIFRLAQFIFHLFKKKKNVVISLKKKQFTLFFSILFC